ncbi:MAG: GHKL domain-containing protein [Candidatus Eisenbacteria bacterium]|nr:GHKL domain-containing protein [Candidatus Eisenbacteria bacterium]
MTTRYALARSGDRRDVAVGGIAALALGVVVAGVLGRPPFYGLLFVGGAVPLGTLAVTAGRRRAAYAALSPGTPIEELGRRIMGFRHGGQGDFDARPGDRVSDDARKNITQLAYLAREMLEARGEQKRYEAMKSVLEKGATMFRESVAPEVSQLAALGRDLGFMTESLNSMESAAARIDHALKAVLEDPASEKEQFAQLVAEIRDGRQELVDSAEAVCAAVLANPGCSLNSVLDDVLTLRQEFLASNAVSLTLDSDVPATADAVRGTRYVLFTILENLLANAVRAMEGARSKSLEITARSDGERCVVAVRDTGRGMSAADVESVFEEAADASRGGFGLPYSRRVLRELGGEMSVESTSGAGTTVLVEIPHWRSTYTGDDHEPEL